MNFRPIPAFTAVFLPMFLALIALGIWQLERLQWKLGLIAQMSGHTHAAPISADEALKLPAEQAQYRRVRLSGRFENDKEALVYTTGPNGIAVYHVLTPFRLDDGRVFMVDRGLIPLELKNPAARRAGILTGETSVAGIWRIPDPPGLFTPAPDLRHRVWFDRDVQDMARQSGVALAAPVLVEADATPVPGGWPKGGQTVVSLPNDHLQYAITWFLLAAALVVVYFAYHRARGRLGFRN